MITNSYTAAIENIHVSEGAIEAAIAAAKQRAAEQRAATAVSAQAKIRYAAIAASVVLAGAASAAYFTNIGRIAPPVVPSPVSATETAVAAETAPTSASTHPAISETNTATEPQEATAPQSAVTEAPAPTVFKPTESHSDPNPTEKPAAPTTAPQKPTEPPPQAPPTEAAGPYDLADNVDPSLLCADGKLYMAIAETGLTHIDDPAAFSDDHLYYIDTKFGRYYLPKPFELKPIVPSWVDEPKSDETVYLYNSDGEIVAEAPVWW